MKRFIGVIAVVLLLWPLAIASGKGDDIFGPDGFDWLKWGIETKIVYVVGFARGIAYLAMETGVVNPRNYDVKKAEEVAKALRTSTLNKDNKRTFTPQEVWLLLEAEKNFEFNLLWDYLITGRDAEITKELDSFYADDKNKLIHISDAIYVVRRQVHGASPEEIEAICQMLRAVDLGNIPERIQIDEQGHIRKIVIYKDNEGHSQYIIWPSGRPAPPIK